MVNIEDFIKRLEIILDYYNLNASSFADKIGVQRSSLSHLLSGRNKPSLDFILKILDVFPDIDLYWILNGKGTFPKYECEIPKNQLRLFRNKTPLLLLIQKLFRKMYSLKYKMLIYQMQSKHNKATSETIIEIASSGEIEKIVLFYKNGTFKVYNSN